MLSGWRGVRPQRRMDLCLEPSPGEHDCCVFQVSISSSRVILRSSGCRLADERTRLPVLLESFSDPESDLPSYLPSRFPKLMNAA